MRINTEIDRSPDLKRLYSKNPQVYTDRQKNMCIYIKVRTQKKTSTTKQAEKSTQIVVMTHC